MKTYVWIEKTKTLLLTNLKIKSEQGNSRSIVDADKESKIPGHHNYEIL